MARRAITRDWAPISLPVAMLLQPNTEKCLRLIRVQEVNKFRCQFRAMEFEVL